MNTPSSNGKPPVVLKKPALPPPSPVEEQETYVECDQQEEPEDYLTFHPSPDNEDVGGDVYEAMDLTNAEDLGQEVYEEPGVYVYVSLELMYVCIY